MGLTEDMGDVLTYWVLDELTDQIVGQSEVHSAKDPSKEPEFESKCSQFRNWGDRSRTNRTCSDT
jgi:hypothetical protein